MMEQAIKKRIEKFLTNRLQEEGTINAMMEMKLVSYDVSTRSIVLSFPVQRWQLNPVHHMHGGMICATLDIAMGCASYVYSEADFTPTIQMSVNFVKSIQEQDNLIVKGICDHTGSRMSQARAIAIVEHKEGVVASANGSYAINTHH